MCESNHISDNILWFVFPLLLINLVLQVILISDWSYDHHNTRL